MNWTIRARDYNTARYNSKCSACTIGQDQPKYAIPHSCIYPVGTTAPLMIVTSYPKETDAIKGRILNGADRSQLLTWLKQVEANIPLYITTAVKCMPPNERNPRPEEIHTCSLLHLNKELELINPKVVLLLGKDAIRAFFHCTVTEAKERLLEHLPTFSRFTSREHKWTGSVYTAYHPSYFKMGGSTALDKEYDSIHQLKLAIKEVQNYGT